jgi:ABC-type sugar transport system ATPase subunit
MTDQAHVRLTSLEKHFGAFQALKDINLSVEKGEFCALLGPSGCGKSTLLRLIAGLEEASTGRIEIAGRDVTMLEPSDRQIAMVFQSYALYPHMNVAENIAFSLEAAGVSKTTRLAKAAEVARLLQLDHLLDRKPAALSGGQRQRVAIGRALVRDPQVFLFDEPLSNLDALLRVQMRIELSNLHRQIGATMIYVTHDQVEAMTMADKIVVMSAGQVQQVGAPMDLYDNPANRFVAGFIGNPAMNFLNVAALPPSLRPVGAQELGIRPEHVQLTGADAPLQGPVRLVERLGNQTLIHVETPAGPVCAQAPGHATARLGESVGLALEPGRAFLFDAQGRRV